jgi:hypothetical protein
VVIKLRRHVFELECFKTIVGKRGIKNDQDHKRIRRFLRAIPGEAGGVAGDLEGTD